MNIYPFAGEIKMTKVIKDGQEVIEWEQVDMSKPETEWARVDKDLNVTHLDMELCAQGPQNVYTALALAIWNKAIAQEREACAKVVEDYCGAWNDEGYALAAAIRART